MTKLSSLLAVLVLVSALSVVHARHENRAAFVTLQELVTQRDELNVTWNQLLLEQATHLVHHRVDHTAQTVLKMTAPSGKRMVTLVLLPQDAGNESIVRLPQVPQTVAQVSYAEAVVATR